MSHKINEKKGMFYALAGFSLLAIGDLFIKFLSEDGFDPAEIAFFLNLFYLPFLLLLSPILGGIKATLRTENLWLHIFRAFLGIITFMIVVNAFHKLGFSLTYSLIFAAPFFATIISAVFLKHKVHAHRWTAIIAGFIGVLIILRPGFVVIEPVAYTVLFAAILIAINHILARKIGEHEPLMAFTMFQCVIAVQVFAFMIFWDGEAKIPLGTDWLHFLVIAIFHMSGALLTSRAFAIADTAVVAPFHYVQLLWGTGFGIIIFSTVPDIWTGLGALIIVFSGIYLIYREKIRKVEITTGVTSHGSIDND